MRTGIKFFTMLLLLLFTTTEAATYLRENLKRAKSGDFIVTSQNKAFTLLHIYDKTPESLIIEEITVPAKRMPKGEYTWKSWVENEAPQHTSWVMYEINLANGLMQECFSFSQNGWYNIPQADNFMSTLLNLRLTPIPERSRKKVGPRPTLGSPDQRRPWQPRMVVDGKIIPGVSFQALRTRWPRDGSELSGKLIEVYVPEEGQDYPSYFPYWLQISGLIGKAKVRIIDSGTGLTSPKPPLPNRNAYTS